ncbi:hypothetical protein TKWG_13165 [Advenella kashmirensis WT001]|uniref:Uncharacterized protein n=1 Tax=Advenella kashmirensis (strain DSM 17095 / LMG 22695 / WT001) TaxID=1036672 RepID=I3UCM1_ADVKW|nr:hypothetical protein [Advenella kashmirensis]AFK62759.1 hypothetical protein TKWG_13165 [Advenella kashmirensis WT001]
MTTLTIADRDMLYSLSWYMSARQTALRTALSYRAPLSVTELADMRVHYSGYFLNLLAAIDIVPNMPMLESEQFEKQLQTRLVFEGFQDGVNNYSYIRELRNAIVHRGLDITSAAHFDDNFPMILAEPKVQNKKGTKTFLAFDKYLLDIIAKCEFVVCPLMLDCLNAAGIFDATVDSEADLQEYRNSVKQSHAMPEQVKAMALRAEINPQWIVDVHSATMTRLREKLAPYDVTMAFPR